MLRVLLIPAEIRMLVKNAENSSSVRKLKLNIGIKQLQMQKWIVRIPTADPLRL